jgi:hypothetical protein
MAVPGIRKRAEAARTPLWDHGRTLRCTACRTASCGLPYRIVRVTVTETSDEDPAATHWSWVDASADEPAWALTWPSRAQFEICFPYGVKAEEEAGKGRAIRLHVEEPPARKLVKGELDDAR